MENTAARGAKMQQSRPPLSGAAAPTSYLSTNLHPAYVYSDSNYSLYYPQLQIPNPNLHYQQSYSTNGLNSLVHPPGVDPNPAISVGNHTNSSYVHDAHQLALAHAYPQGPVSVPLAEAVAIAYHQDNNFANLQLNPYSNGVTIQPTVAETFMAANRKSTLSRKTSIGPRNINNSSNKAPKKVKVVQSAWCEVCKVDCNSKNVLDEHKLGKKHKRNLEKLITASIQINVPAPAPPPAPAPAPVSAPASGNTLIGPQENPSGKKAKRKTAGKEDLETKKKKVLEGGAAAEAVRMCHICKVICNSETVFKYHLAGQKHAAMMKRHASTSIIRATTMTALASTSAGIAATSTIASVAAT